jgi:hypothetical protein
MRTTDYDKLAACAPLDQTAAVVTGQAGCVVLGDEASDDNTSLFLSTRNPLPLKKITSQMKAHHQFVDFTGRPYGQMTVLGLHRDAPPKKGARWVVRCPCGTYETRRTRILRRDADSPETIASGVCNDCEKREHYTRKYSHGRRAG